MATTKRLKANYGVDAPSIAGGSSTTSTLQLRPTSGAGTTSADIVFQVGNNGATEAMRVTGNATVGIGTSAPSATFEVANSSGNVPASATVANSSQTGAEYRGRKSRGTLSSPTAVLIGDTLAKFSAAGHNGTAYSAETGSVNFVAAEDWTATANGTYLSLSTTPVGVTSPLERIRITPDGKIGVKTSSPIADFEIDGSIRSVSYNYPNILLNPANRLAIGETFPPPNDYANSIVSFGSGSNTLGMAFAFSKTGVHTSFFGDDGTKLAIVTENLVPIVFATNTSYYAYDVLNTGTERMRIDGGGNVGIGTAAPAYLLDVNGTANATLLRSNGVQFPATQVPSADANTLDDYEEGTFTPTIVGATVAGVGTYTIQVGQYTKIGRVVHFNLYLNWTAHTGTGTMRVGGLPFTSTATANAFTSVAIGYWNNLAITAGATPMAHVLTNSTQIILYQMPSGGGAMALVNMDAAAGLMIAGSYNVG